MDILKQHIAEETFVVANSIEHVYYISFLWDGTYVSVAWDSISESISTYDDTYGDDIDYVELNAFVKETLHKKIS